MGNSSSASAKKQRKSELFRRKKKNNNQDIEKDDDNWIFECVIEYIQSPQCSAFVEGFIDENCLVFDAINDNDNDNEDLSGFEHRQLHIQYKNMVETLLMKRLGKMGISAQQFTDSCQKCNKQQLDSTIVHYIAAIDDFTAFKHIMVQRNIQLEKQAIMYLQHKNQINNDNDNNNKQMSEQQQLEWALSESLRLREEQHKLEQQQQQQQPLQKASESVDPSAPILMNNNYDVIKKPTLKPLKPLNIYKDDNPFIAPKMSNDELLSNDELQPLTAESIKTIKQKQANSSILKQKQMILDLRKQKRNQEIESFEPGAPNSDWIQHLNKNNESTLPPLSKSLFTKISQNKDYTFE